MSASRVWRVGVGRCLCASLLSLLSGHAAVGQTPPASPTPAAERSFALEYHAAADCPDGLALVSAIQTRTAGAALVAADAAAVRIKVELQPDGQSQLWVTLAEGSFRREFPSASCADAVASMAVIVSMVLEAEPASRKAMAEGTTETETEAEAAAGTGTGTEAKTETETEAKTETETETETETIAEPETAAAVPARRSVATPVRVRQPARRSFGFSIKGSGALETAVAPTPPPGAAIGFEAWARPSQLLAPGVVAEFLVTTTATETTVDGRADFQLLAGRIQGCLLRVPLTPAARLIPCGLFEAGSLHAAGGGSEISNPQQVTMPWVAGGLALRAQWDIFRGLALEGSGSVKGLLRSDTFIFEPSSLVYDVPRLSFGLGLGLSLRVH